MKAIVLLVLHAALLACSPAPHSGNQGAAAPASGAPSAVDALPQASPASDAATGDAVLVPGEYRIAGVDGAEIDQPYAITASITAGRIHVTADCLNFAWDYTARADNIATERVAVEGCARGLTAAEDAVVAAFSSATKVVRTPANAIELRGTAHWVTLYAQ